MLRACAPSRSYDDVYGVVGAGTVCYRVEPCKEMVAVRNICCGQGAGRVCGRAAGPACCNFDYYNATRSAEIESLFEAELQASGARPHALVAFPRGAASHSNAARVPLHSLGDSTPRSHSHRVLVPVPRAYAAMPHAQCPQRLSCITINS